MSHQSPFLQLPRNLDITQMLYMDGIRFSADMAEVSYTRLRDTLLSLTTKTVKGEKIDHVYSYILPAISDAWSIVDSVYRLRGLLEQTPRMKQNTPNMVAFKKATDDLEELRNCIQHLNHQIRNLVDRKLPVLGILKWVTILDSGSNVCYSCSIIAGTIVNRVIPFTNPLGHEYRPPIDSITLVSTKSIDLTSIMERMKIVVSSIAKQINEQTTGMPQAGSDLFILLKIEAVQ